MPVGGREFYPYMHAGSWLGVYPSPHLPPTLTHWFMVVLLDWYEVRVRTCRLHFIFPAGFLFITTAVAIQQ